MQIGMQIGMHIGMQIRWPSGGTTATKMKRMSFPSVSVFVFLFFFFLLLLVFFFWSFLFANLVANHVAGRFFVFYCR